MEAIAVAGQRARAPLAPCTRGIMQHSANAAGQGVGTATRAEDADARAAVEGRPIDPRKSCLNCLFSRCLRNALNSHQTDHNVLRSYCSGLWQCVMA